MSELRFNTYYRTVIELGRRSGVPLPWDGDESDRKKLAYGCFQAVVAAFLFFKLICAAYAMAYNDKFEDVIYGSAVLMFTLTGNLITLFYVFWSDEFRTVLHNMDKVCDMISKSNLKEKPFFENLYKHDARMLSKFTKFLGTSTIVSPFFYVFSVPVYNAIQGNYTHKVGLPTHCPFELQTPEAFEVVILLEFCGLLFPALQKLGNEFIMLGLFKIQAAYFKYLSVVLENIEDSLGKGPLEDQETLISWIRLNQAVNKNAQELITFFSPLVVLYYVSIICIVAGGVFYQLNGAELLQGVFLGMYMVITVIHLFIQCQMADELSSASENLAQSVYNIPWYKMDVKSKGFIKLIICMANRPIHVVAYRAPNFTLNKETFVKFMTNTISAYMGFNKIMNINN